MELTNNSISTILPKFTKLFNNSLETYNKISEAIISNVKEVSIEIVDEIGNIKKLPIPTFKFLLSELERLNYNLTQLTTLTDGKEVYVKNGLTNRKVVLSKYSKESKDIKNIPNINSFYYKSNHFFESLMNPNIFIKFDISSSVDLDCESIIVDRYILTSLNDDDLDWFNFTYNNKTEIDRDTFLNDLNFRNIQYTLDNSIVQLPPKELIYAGDYSVLGIYEVEYDEVLNGIIYKRKRKMYKLDKLTYTDLRYDLSDNKTLKQGDILILNDDSTSYVIDVIDYSTNSISLKLRDGFGSINNGTNILKFYSNDIVSINAEISIGFNEYNVIFIKSINSTYKIPSKNWSKGSAFYTNQLTVNNGEFNEKLEEFYKREVLDFGMFLQSLAKDKMLPSYVGIKPNSPVLNSTDFKVVQINRHLFEGKFIEDIKNLETEKIKLQSEIDTLTKSLSKDRSNQTLMNDRISKTELYNSIVKEIESKSSANELSSLSPKYRIRGFFPMPALKVGAETGTQEIVQFLISYRYISNGETNSIQQFAFTENSKTINGVINDKVEDSNVTNINTIDIPIQKNEIVEIKIKSISEAGYPTNPIMSDFSDSVRVVFPSDLENSSVLSNIVEQNKKDIVKVYLQNDLEAYGLYKHILSSFEKNEKYFPHGTVDIDSGFRTTEQNIVPLFDKLLEINNRLLKIEELQQKKTPILNVKLIDSDGNEISIKRNQQNKLFAGYYADYVKGLNIEKGKIVTKTYFLVIENLTASDLELVSRIPGTNTKMVKESSKWEGTAYEDDHDYYDNYKTFELSDNDYNNMRKYDNVPLLITNPNEYDNNGQITNRVPNQSSQVKAQYIYNRFYDVAKENSLYSEYIPDDSGNLTINLILKPQDVENYYTRTVSENSTVGFFWGGNFINGLPTKANSYQINDNAIEVHITHPYIKTLDAFKYYYNLYTGKTIPDNVNDYTIYASEIFLQNKFMSLNNESKGGKKQSIYVYDSINGTRKS